MFLCILQTNVSVVDGSLFIQNLVANETIKN